MSAGGAGRGEVVERGVRFRWVELWSGAIRAMHWIAAGCIVVLVATGFYIGRPYFMTSGEAIDHYMMGRARLLHFLAAGILVGTGVIRVYWLFAGNRYESWRALFPFDRKSLVNFLRQAGHYLMLPRVRRPNYLGHNPIQQFAYTGLYAVIAVQVLTGFALFGAADPDSFFWRRLGIESYYVGGIQIVRFVHHVLTWVILIFVPIHLYFGIRTDVLERHGTISSIFSGGRWVRADTRYEDE
jgi:Ni/Fe-hydrogenase b-type cytochrome subunit